MHGTRDRLQQTWLRRFFGCRRLKSRPAWRVFARAMSPLILPIWAILGAAGLRGGPNGDGFGQCWTAFGSSLHLAYMWYLPEPVLTTGVFFMADSSVLSGRDGSAMSASKATGLPDILPQTTPKFCGSGAAPAHLLSWQAFPWDGGPFAFGARRHQAQALPSQIFCHLIPAGRAGCCHAHSS